MTTKDEVISAIETADARVKALTPALREHGADPLPDSEWDVREALCHVAARANAVPLSLSIMQRMLSATGQTQPLDPGAAARRSAAINQAQLEERMDRSMDQVLAEIEAGHQAAIATVRDMPQTEFDQRFQRVTGDGDTSLGEMILRAGAGHEKEHLDQIERALGGAAG
jgi:DinB family protein